MKFQSYSLYRCTGASECNQICAHKNYHLRFYAESIESDPCDIDIKLNNCYIKGKYVCCKPQTVIRKLIV